MSNESYSSIFSSVNGCDSIIITDIVVNELPIIDAGSSTSLCDGESITLTANNPNGASLAWDNGITNGTPFTPTSSLTYTVTATDANNCISTDFVIVTVNQNPTASFNADELFGCAPLEVTFTNTSLGSLTQCNWDFGNGQTASGCGTISNTFNSIGAQTVSLSIVDANGCASSVTNTDYINVYLQPEASFTALNNPTNILKPEVNFINSSLNSNFYVWNFGDNSGNSNETNPTHLYSNEDPGNYEVTLIAYNGTCTDTAMLLIVIDDVIIYYVPNTFTPDGDAINQTFKPVFTSGYDPYDYQLLIFNRWGELLFESHNTEIGWDGTYNGIVVQDGIYSWTLEFKETMSDARHSVQGHVNLLR